MNQKEENQVLYQIKSFDRLVCKHMMKIAWVDGNVEGQAYYGWILDYLKREQDKPIYQKDIEKKFQIGKSTVAGIIKGMEAKQYIVRNAVEGDARLKQVCITEQGEQYLIEIQKNFEQLEQTIKKDISVEELQQFMHTIEKMKANIADAIR